jgi:hypothetical protein
MRYLFIVLLFASCNHYKKKVDCERYRNGRFLLINSVERVVEYKIDRNDSIQTETDQTGFISMQKVRWIDPCTYELTFLSSNHPPLSDSSANSEEMRRLRQIPYITKIVATGENYYVFRAKKRGTGYEYSDTLWEVIKGTHPTEDTVKQ